MSAKESLNGTNWPQIPVSLPSPDWGPRRGLLLRGDLPVFLGAPLPWEGSGRETLRIFAGRSVSETPSAFSTDQHYLNAPTAGLPAAAPGLRNCARARVQHCTQMWSAKTRVTLSMLLSSRPGMVARGNTETTSSRILSFAGILPLREAAPCWGPREASNGESPGALKTLPFCNRQPRHSEPLSPRP